MKTVTLAASKGGAGKSSLAIGMSSVLHKRGVRTTLLDLDEQGSLATWPSTNDGRIPRHDPDLLTIIHQPSGGDDDQSLVACLNRIAEIREAGECDVLIIDTKGEIGRTTSVVAAQSDCVVCPTNGHSLEFEPILVTYNSINAALTALGAEHRIDEIFRIVLTKTKIVEAADIRAAQAVIRRKFTTFEGPGDTSVFNKAHQFGTTIDRIAEAADAAAKTAKSPKTRANAVREFKRCDKALERLGVMTDLILGVNP